MTTASNMLPVSVNTSHMLKLTKENKEKGLNVLSAWTVLEILSPSPFDKKAYESVNSNGSNLFNSGKGRVIDIASSSDGNKAPWEEPIVRPLGAPQDRYFYQVVLGTILLKNAVNALINTYGTEDGEEYRSHEAKGEALIAVITVDENGFLIARNRAINISSFAWSLPKALDKDLQGLKEWPQAEKEIEDRFWKKLDREDQWGTKLPLSLASIDEAYQYLIKTLGLRAELVNPKKIAIERMVPGTEKEVYPSPLNMNSFYLEDLLQASALVKSDKAPETLLKYLGTIAPTEKINIQGPGKEVIIEDIVAPHNMPPAKWPGNRENHLVLLQQAAVNLAMKKLGANDILGINGPPGTGKTTLLRDIIAAIICDRAEQLASFEDVKKAFPTSEEVALPDNKTVTLYHLDKRLQGFEILIASSNNNAVENISTELPKLDAIDEHIDLRYFHTLSDALSRKEGSTWGLMSAVLGKNENIFAFVNKFWNDQDRGMAAYLLKMRERFRKTTATDPASKSAIGISRTPRIVSENEKHMPTNYEEALEKWKEVRENFLSIKQETEQSLTYLEAIRTYTKGLDTLGSGSENLESPTNRLEKSIRENTKAQPFLFSRPLDAQAAPSWEKEHKWLSHLQNLRGTINKADVLNLEETLIDKKFFRQDHEKIQKTSPWNEPSTQLLREKLFVAAIELHRAFINVAAEQIYENLSAFSLILKNKGHTIPLDKRQEFMKDLWATFFLVVPSVSTTFASVNRMLQDIRPNTWGWLLIDEGGQALPQSAVGAIIRSKRVIVTGDPLQIKPIVTLPSKVTKAICQEFKVNPNRFNAPEASVQTLADAASSYFAKFIDGVGTRQVGIPLLVHRRCSDPMFSIANAIAYEGEMVYGKSEQLSPIRDVLGESRWFDVQGMDIGNWCPQEDDQVIRLLFALQGKKVDPDLYIVTPFKNVAKNLREAIKDSMISKRWLTGLGGNDQQPLSKDDWKHVYFWLHTRIGTIHTMQGREAEAVILVLGAQGSAGARDWASEEPNILNVAATRAKEVLYVVGNKELWKKAGNKERLFEKLHAIMEG